VTWRAAVVGAGPAGFYTTGLLLDAGFAVDLYDALPTPFGLVRAGVAPDHPRIKSVTRVFERTAAHPSFRFVGGTELGVDVSRDQLVESYHAVVYATGASGDRRLGIPGEDLPGSHSATSFVGWYNGHPQYADHAFDLTAERAVVVGNGNVAVDVARMLVIDPAELRATDTADHALEMLAQSAIREVILLGRRGPAQAAFTTPELRELGSLTRAEVVVSPDDAAPDDLSRAWLDQSGELTTQRNLDLLLTYAKRPQQGHSHRIVVRFLRSPVAILGDGRVEAIRVSVNALIADGRGGLRAVPTGFEEEISAGLVLRAVGYRGLSIPGVPYDAERGVVRNCDGRVGDENGEILVGEYVVGWIKRGPSGVIGTNKKDAADTVARILADRDADRLRSPLGDSGDILTEREPKRRPVPWDGWQAIDAHETALGDRDGRPRVKVVSVDSLLGIAHGSGDPAGSPR
jgi:ferredoxin--NADP+ reductase